MFIRPSACFRAHFSQSTKSDILEGWFFITRWDPVFLILPQNTFSPAYTYHLFFRFLDIVSVIILFFAYRRIRL